MPVSPFGKASGSCGPCQAWSRETGSATRIVSMTARPLFELVAAGVFDAALYYCLNVVLLRVEAPPPKGIDAQNEC